MVNIDDCEKVLLGVKVPHSKICDVMSESDILSTKKFKNKVLTVDTANADLGFWLSNEYIKVDHAKMGKYSNFDIRDTQSQSSGTTYFYKGYFFVSKDCSSALHLMMLNNNNYKVFLYKCLDLSVIYRYHDKKN